MKRLVQLGIFQLLMWSLLQCGGQESLSSKVKFASRDPNAIIVYADLTVSNGEEDIEYKAPWFRWRYTFVNNSTLQLRVVTAMFTITTRKNGVKVTYETAIDPGANCKDPFSRSYLAVVEPGETFSGLAVDATGVANCDMFNLALRLTPPQSEEWVIHQLPESDTKSYSVEIQAIGWFEENIPGEVTSRDVIERFEAYDFIVAN